MTDDPVCEADFLERGGNLSFNFGEPLAWGGVMATLKILEPTTSASGGCEEVGDSSESFGAAWVESSVEDM